MGTEIDKSNIAAGHAALAICESLLIALIEQGIVSARDVRGVLVDAAATHREVDSQDAAQMTVLHTAAELIDRIRGDLDKLP